MLALSIPPQVVFDGALTGLTYGLAAVAVILVYRTSRVINLATAEMGGVAAALLAYLVINHGMNYWLALVLSVVIGAVTGVVIELTVVRRLSKAPRIMLLVATIGLAQLLLFTQTLFPVPTKVQPYPTPFAASWKVGDVIVRSQQLMVLVVMPLLALLLAWFLARTRVGLAVRAAAANPAAGRLAGIAVQRTSTLVWGIAGAFTALATILAAPFTTTTSQEVFTMGPGLLVRVLAAALIGGMTSLPLAIVGGMAIGAIDSVVYYNAPSARGLTDLVIFGVVALVLLVLSRRNGRESTAEWSFAPRSRVSGAGGRRSPVARSLPIVAGVVGLGLALLPMVLANTASQQFNWSRVVLYAMAALSLTVLTGWSGQLSIGQFAFVGLGGMTAAALVRVDVGPGPALLAATLIGAAAAVIVGLPSLRLPGLFVAVSTLALGVATASWLLSRSFFLHGEPAASLPRLIIGDVSLESQRTYYFVCLVFLLAAMFAMSRLRRTGVGRAFIAVRSNQAAAASFGLSPTRTKLTAFAISGGLAGLSGALLAGLLVTIPTDRFSAAESLQLVSIAVIGGLASVPGAVLGALYVVGIPALAPANSKLPLVSSGVGLLVLILFLPGGLAALCERIRDWMVRVFSSDDDGSSAPRPSASVANIRLHPAAEERRDDGPAESLAVHGMDVTRGERLVVHGVDLVVRPGEIVGLIGANGAGKSTIMDAVGGFLPYRGRVTIDGRDADGLSPSQRARQGLGRTRQGADLFGDLTVRETVQVALDHRHHVDALSAMAGLPHTWRRERRCRTEADELLDSFDLAMFAQRYVDELSTGTRRLLELACVVVQGARVICLDEPTAGMAQRESEMLAPFLVRLRDELGASLLVIEHDMTFLCNASDRLYCLDLGAIIAEGEPDEVRRDPAVVAAYLGTDATAINRSGTAPV